MAGWLGNSLGPNLAALLTALWLPRLCHGRSCIGASGGISGFTFLSRVKADFSREQVARGGLLYVFKTAAPEEVLPGWTTSVLALFSCLLLCIPFISCLHHFSHLNAPFLQATKADVNTACSKGILLSLQAGDFLAWHVKCWDSGSPLLTQPSWTALQLSWG